MNLKKQGTIPKLEVQINASNEVTKWMHQFQ